MAEALLFPEINEAALDAPSTALAPAQAAAIAQHRPTVKEVVIAGFRDSEPVLRTLVARYTDVVFDVSTPAGLAQAKAARHDLREHGRYVVQRSRDAAKDSVNKLKPVIEEEAERLIAIVKPLEDSIDAQITAREEQLAAEKAERDRIAAERRAKFEAEIEKIRGYATAARELPVERVAKGIEFVENLAFGDEWAEFAADAATAQAQTLTTMRTILAEKREAMRVAAEAEARRIEQERIAAEQAAERERLAQEAADLAAQRAELQRRLAEVTIERDILPPLIADAEPRDSPDDGMTDPVDQAGDLASQRAAARSLTETIARAEVHAERVCEDLERQGYSIEVEAASQADSASRRSPTVTVTYLDPALDGLQSITLKGPIPITFAEPEATADDAPPISVGDITRRLSPLSITTRGLEALGFTPVATGGRAVLYRASAWPLIKAAILAHVEGLQ